MAGNRAVHPALIDAATSIPRHRKIPVFFPVGILRETGIASLRNHHEMYNEKGIPAQLLT
jgi:hypothetical protein